MYKVRESVKAKSKTWSTPLVDKGKKLLTPLVNVDVECKNNWTDVS